MEGGKFCHPPIIYIIVRACYYIFKKIPHILLLRPSCINFAVRNSDC